MANVRTNPALVTQCDVCSYYHVGECPTPVPTLAIDTASESSDTEGLTRCSGEIAEILYMSEEKALAVLRAELDALKDRNHESNSDLRVDLAKLTTEVHSNHIAQNNKRLALADDVTANREDLIVLVGKDGKGGAIASFSGQLKKLWLITDDLKSKYWKLAALVGVSAAGGGAAAKFFL